LWEAVRLQVTGQTEGEVLLHLTTLSVTNITQSQWQINETRVSSVCVEATSGILVTGKSNPNDALLGYHTMCDNR